MKRPLCLLTLIASLALLYAAPAQAGEIAVDPAPLQASDDFDTPRFEFATETAYLLSFIGNPNSYEIGAQFFTGRLRWGVNRENDSIFRGYNQIYLLGMVEPIFRGPENHYFGISAGFRHVFVRPGWRMQRESLEILIGYFVRQVLELMIY